MIAMGSFEYNKIDIDAVEEVELLSPESSSYRQFKQELYDSSDDVPEERRRMAESQRSAVYVWLASQLVDADCEQLIEDMFVLTANIPNYVKNADELREGLLREGEYTDVDVEYGNLTPDVRGECGHAQNDDYRPDDDDAMCCWECSPENTRKPAKFMADDPPCDTCSISVPARFALKRELANTISIGQTGKLSNQFRHSDLPPQDILSRLAAADESRPQAIQLAFRVAYPDEDYYYQRAEALLRDLDADIAEQSGPGAGGRKFEHDAIKRLEEKFELRDETVFKIKFDEDAGRGYWEQFVSDPAEPTFKEADAIIEGEVGPIVVDFFTQRHTIEKRRQVSNYAELYEAATGEEPKAWGITDETYAELFELDTLVDDTDDLEEGQADISDFI